MMRCAVPTMVAECWHVAVQKKKTKTKSEGMTRIDSRSSGSNNNTKVSETVNNVHVRLSTRCSSGASLI